MSVASATKTEYKLTVGIEVHAELKTKSKMFCGCKNDPHYSAPNTLVCPTCTAHPGTLPRVNKEAVKKVLLVGKALDGELALYSEFDRKNYFYPDIPKAYQLSQYAYPFVSGGKLGDVAITRVHLEEDTARSQHEGSESIIDFNRAGVPLMELVTEPVIHDAKEAASFARELQLLLRFLGVSSANMEKGEMRVEANISISKTDDLGTKVEVKNLNSFKAVEQAIQYEVKRQTEVLALGEAVIQETRGWDENKSKTFSQRTKEAADDYRYFPDPDIPKYSISEVDDFSDSRIEEIMPELPSIIRDKLTELGLQSDQTDTLLYNASLLTYFNETVAKWPDDRAKVKLAANYITSDIVGLMQTYPDKRIVDESTEQFAKLIEMVANSEVTSRVAKDLLPDVVFENLDPKNIAEDKGLLQSNSEEELLPLVETIITENQSVVDEFRAGKAASLQFLVGQGMKATKGSANPKLLADLLQKKIAD